ncbi:MAG TPA: hypothetical protein DIW81_21195, partial [Planctomycetaceae bacterium]|nr:hypothetical protein [Planctomycetaceae bacterium]
VSGAERCCIRAPSRVESVVFSPDGTRIVGGYYYHCTEWVWDSVSGKELASLRKNDQDVTSLTERACLRGHEEKVTQVVFSPDGNWIASGSSDQSVRVWNVVSSAQQIILRGHQDCVTSIAYSPDGNRIISGSLDQTVRIWDVHMSRLPRMFKNVIYWLKKVTSPEPNSLVGHNGGVLCVNFSPNGMRIVSGSQDQTIRVWDATSGLQLTCLEGHKGGVTSVVFSPNGTLIVSGSDDRTVR